MQPLHLANAGTRVQERVARMEEEIEVDKVTTRLLLTSKPLPTIADVLNETMESAFQEMSKAIYANGFTYGNVPRNGIITNIKAPRP